MTKNKALTIVSVAALGVLGLLGHKWLSNTAAKCDKGTQRVESLGASFCLDDDSTAYLRCVESRVSRLDASWKAKAGGALELIVDGETIAAKGSNQKTLEVTAENTDVAIQEGLKACRPLAPAQGIKVDVIDSKDTNIHIQVAN